MDSNMADKLKAMLDDPETLNKLSTLLGNIQQSQTADTQDVSEEIMPQASSDTPDPSEAISKIQQMMGQVSPANDPRINLLNSLKPYMRKNRSEKMDQAIRLIQISKMANLFKL